MAQLLARHMSVGSSQKSGQGSVPAEQMPQSGRSRHRCRTGRPGTGCRSAGTRWPDSCCRLPSQLSATSQPFITSGRHTAVLLASAGQASLMPSQLSARSHTPSRRPADGRALGVAPDSRSCCRRRSRRRRRRRPRRGSPSPPAPGRRPDSSPPRRRTPPRRRPDRRWRLGTRRVVGSSLPVAHARQTAVGVGADVIGRIAARRAVR